MAAADDAEFARLWMSGMTPTAIGDVLGLRPNTVKARRSRAGLPPHVDVLATVHRDAILRHHRAGLTPVHIRERLPDGVGEAVVRRALDIEGLTPNVGVSGRPKRRHEPSAEERERALARAARTEMTARCARCGFESEGPFIDARRAFREHACRAAARGSRARLHAPAARRATPAGRADGRRSRPAHAGHPAAHDARGGGAGLPAAGHRRSV